MSFPAGRLLYRALQQCYRRQRHELGAGRLSAGLYCALGLIAWNLLRLESPAWLALLAQPGFARLHQRRARPGDPLRYGLQAISSLFLHPRHIADSLSLSPDRNLWQRLNARHLTLLQRLASRLTRLGERLLQPDAVQVPKAVLSANWPIKILFTLVVVMLVLVITQPFSLGAQAIFTLLLWGIARIIMLIPGRLATLVLVVLSLMVSTRYLWWRYTSTLNWSSSLDVFFGLLLLLAETYSWLVLLLGYVQTLWPLNRPLAELPEEVDSWPCVDLMISTYNEGLDVVRPTVLAALGIDWPRDKLRIHLLDDGHREIMRQLAQEAGIGYITRDDNRHAKAGNLNHALSRTSAEFVAIFDCDHIPQRSFLQLTMSWFLKDRRLGLIQTPHHFFSPDPFERNLGRFRRMPNEGTLFYGLVQDGNDLWNAAFFCGSCAILRRQALEAIGGFAVETVTEDAHTALRLHRNGYHSAYLRIPQAAGLATESLAAHIGQRIRWARGMVQIFRLDNPLRGKGLSLAQRLCYCNAMLHFLSGIPRLIFLTAPLAFLFFHAYIIHASALAILLFAGPHILHSSLTNARVQGRYRPAFWSEIYDSVLSWYTARPTLVALFSPHRGKFNVTDKGGGFKKSYFDWTISRPYLLLVALNLMGVIAAGWHVAYGTINDLPTVAISLVWTLYNLMILGGAIAVAAEVRQVRQAHRVEVKLPASLALPDGHVYACWLRDYSEGGAGLELPAGLTLSQGLPVTLLLKRGSQEHAFDAQVVYGQHSRVGLRLSPMSLARHINYIQCTFARADTWLQWQDSFVETRLMQSFGDVLKLSLGGYARLIQYAPLPFRRSIKWLASFLPRRNIPTPPAPATLKESVI